MEAREKSERSVSLAALIGGAILLCVVVPKIFKTSEDTLQSIGAAGIVGEGVMGLIVAILIGAGVLG
jgi:hypothetical protein